MLKALNINIEIKFYLFKMGVKEAYLENNPVKVGFLYRDVEIWFKVCLMFTSKNGRVEFSSLSQVNLILICFELRYSKNF